MDAKEKAKKVVADWHAEDPLFKDLDILVGKIALALKEQDRDTRHACAEAVLSCQCVCETPNGNDAISPDDAHAVCMNVRVFEKAEPNG